MLEYNRTKYQLKPGGCHNCHLKEACRQHLFVDKLIELDDDQSCLYKTKFHFEAVALPNPIFVLDESHR